MENKFSFSDKPIAAKIVYAVVIGILCVTAIIVGIVAAASKPEEVPNEPPVETPGTPGDNTPTPPDDVVPEVKPQSFISPHEGEIMEHHDLTAPVYSETLGAWRVHAGIDIAAEDGDDVRAAESGKITRIYNDPKYGHTVEIEHREGMVSRYSNLKADSSPFKVGDEVKRGDVIGKVGDTATSELAKEPHLHFELLKDGKKVNPLDHLADREDD